MLIIALLFHQKFVVVHLTLNEHPSAMAHSFHRADLNVPQIVLIARNKAIYFRITESIFQQNKKRKEVKCDTVECFHMLDISIY